MRCGVFAQQVPDVRPLMDSVFQKETGFFVGVHPFSMVWLRIKATPSEELTPAQSSFGHRPLLPKDFPYPMDVEGLLY